MARSLIAVLRREFGPRTDALTRREMLHATALAAAGLLISGGRALAQEKTAKGGKRVVIVGAGFSGLACAYELKAAGYDVTVVEATNRPGGRVLSFNDFVPGKVVEGGAELIGSNHPAWVAYAKKFNLEFIDVTEDEELEYPLVIGGKRLDKEAANAIWEELDASLRKMDADAEKVNPDEPWKTPDAEALDKRSLADWIAKCEAGEDTKKAITAMLAGDNGAPTAKQSYLGMITQVKGGTFGEMNYWDHSEVYRCKQGNDALAKNLAEGIGRDRLILGLPVKKIAVQGDKAVLTCSDGRTIECDDVVLSVPPSVWHKIEFSPGLPTALKPQMGVNIKYLTHVKKRFWKEGKLGEFALTDGDIAWAWESTQNQEGDENVGLTCFSGGDGAEAIRKRDNAARKAFYEEQMEKLYPGFKENFVAARFMDWPGMQWAMGGYSFPAPGQVTTVGPLLQKGLGRLHFVGEHTCYKFVGYMEGALSSGAALAKKLAVRDGIVK